MKRAWGCGKGLHRVGTAMAVVTALLLSAKPSAAQNVDRPYLSLDGTVLSVDSITVEPPLGGRDFDESATSIGLLGSGVGFGAGAGVSDNVVLGGQIRATSQTFKSDEETTLEVSSFSLLPRIEYVFSTGGPARPFLLGFLGASSGTSKTAFIDGNGASGDVEVKETRTMIGAGFGVHLFAAPSFSIDPLISVGAFGGTRTVSILDDDAEASIGGTTVLLTVSLTGWLGQGAAPRPSTSESPSAPEPEAASWSAPGPTAAAPEEESGGPVPVTTNQVLIGEHVLFLKGRPESLRSVVMFRVAEAPNGQVLASCRDIVIVAGEARFATRNVRLLGKRTTQRELRSTAEGLIDVPAIDTLAQDPHAALVVCGERWNLSDSAREGLTTFLAEFRRRGGAPAAMPAEPAEPTAAPSEPAVLESPVPAPPSTAPPATPGTQQPAPPKASFETPAPPPVAPAPKAPAPKPR